jgi:formamidopyrimidine-DNA glycosylase
MYYYTPEQAEVKLAELGHDLKSEDFTYDYFKTCLLKYPKRLIKVCLLDQKLFAGTGNYIPDEICAHTKVFPLRTIASLSLKEIKSLYQATFKVIDDATQTGGTTFQRGYKDTTGSAGFGVQHLVVFYQENCQMCGQSPIKKIVLPQRGTYYCPECQK